MENARAYSRMKAHLGWQWRLLRLFLREAGRMTVIATLCRVAAQFAQLFSLFIPLKIILILGSSSVPGFMQGSLTAATRDAWIGGLTLATLVLYVAAIALDLVANRMVGQGGARLAQWRSATLELDKLQRRQVREIFGIGCRGYANLTVFALGALGLLLLDPVIFLAMAALIGLELAVTNAVCSARGGWLGWLGGAISRNPAEYLKYLAAVNFLCVFGLLLLQYLLHGRLDSLGAILTLLLARRMFQSIGQFGTLAGRLVQAHAGSDGRPLTLV